MSSLGTTQTLSPRVPLAPQLAAGICFPGEMASSSVTCWATGTAL